ncbi:MAG: hypothetical protein CMJ47_14600 [Planctomyces sp.]|nr:hypothetical protein [Planctomyces sp.]
MSEEPCLLSSAPRWQTATNLAQSLIEQGHFRDVSFQILDKQTSELVFLSRDAAPSSARQPLFLVASLTKPVVAAAVLSLVNDGRLLLNERVNIRLPEWNRGERRKITLRHLLCHTSGLPDQLPDNLEMRDQNASLDDFYAGVVKTPLEFSPGSRAQYQSMGFVVLQKLVEQETGQTLPELIRERIFTPLQMHNTFLGAEAKQEDILSRVRAVELDEDQEARTGNWNSDYWRTLGAPWGGMLSTPADMLKFCSAFLNGSNPAIPPSMQQEMATNQLQYFEDMNPRELKHRPWGLGWRFNWKTHRETFGDLLPASIIGHWGATGALMWCDRANERACVICCSRPTTAARPALIQLSNCLASVMDSPD